MPVELFESLHIGSKIPSPSGGEVTVVELDRQERTGNVTLMFDNKTFREATIQAVTQEELSEFLGHCKFEQDDSATFEDKDEE